MKDCERCVYLIGENQKHTDYILELEAENERLTSEVRQLTSVLRAEYAIPGAFGRTRLWGALNTVLEVTPVEDELDQIMRLLNANSTGIDAAMQAESGGEGS